MVYYPQYNYNTIKWNDDIYNDDIFVIKITKLFYSSRCPPLPPCPQLHSGRPRASKKNLAHMKIYCKPNLKYCTKQYFFNKDDPFKLCILPFFSISRCHQLLPLSSTPPAVLISSAVLESSRCPRLIHPAVLDSSCCPQLLPLSSCCPLLPRHSPPVVLSQTLSNIFPFLIISGRQPF